MDDTLTALSRIIRSNSRAAADQIERIARGHHQANHRLRDSHALKYFHQAQRHPLRVGDAQKDQYLTEDVAAEFEYAETDVPGDWHQRNEHKRQAP